MKDMINQIVWSIYIIVIFWKAEMFESIYLLFVHYFAVPFPSCLPLLHHLPLTSFSPLSGIHGDGSIKCIKLHPSLIHRAENRSKERCLFSAPSRLSLLAPPPHPACLLSQSSRLIKTDKQMRGHTQQPKEGWVWLAAQGICPVCALC